MKFVFVILLSFIPFVGAYAQDNDFKDALFTIMHDAPNRFKNIKGKELSQNLNAVVWDCGIKLPGIIAGRFVFTTSYFYEGAILQTRDTTDLRPAYNKYRLILDSCLIPSGYVESNGENIYPMLQNFNKIAYLHTNLPNSNIEEAPAHVALEVTYMKEKRMFTLELFIYRH